jgi:hypothetical protein
MNRRTDEQKIRVDRSIDWTNETRADGSDNIRLQNEKEKRN